MTIIKDRCDYIDSKHQERINKNLTWHLKGSTDFQNSGDGENQLIASMVSGVQGFGSTDYKDHREDTLEDLKALIEPSITKAIQKGHYYDNEGVEITSIVVTGYHGGYTGQFIYKSGKNAFQR